MFKDQKIFVAGHRGLVGSAVVQQLQTKGYQQIITRARAELDLRDQAGVEKFFSEEKPDCVILAAAKVGGILANSTFSADFIHDNLLIQLNVIASAYRHAAKKFVFLGSSCIYPKFAPQPLKEEYLLTSALEPTNEAYAIAKIAGIKMCQAYYQQHRFDSICIMPTNLYGPGDNFDLAGSHVLPAMIRKFHEAKADGSRAVTIWGTGTPKREFLYVDDLAEAIVFLMEQSAEAVDEFAPDRIFNVGVGEDISISELALLVKETVGFHGEIEYDSSKPDGTPRKLLDVSRVRRMGWQAKTSLRVGIGQTYQWFKENFENPAISKKAGAIS